MNDSAICLWKLLQQEKKYLLECKEKKNLKTYADSYMGAHTDIYLEVRLKSKCRETMLKIICLEKLHDTQKEEKKLNDLMKRKWCHINYTSWAIKVVPRGEPGYNVSVVPKTRNRRHVVHREKRRVYLKPKSSWSLCN